MSRALPDPLVRHEAPRARLMPLVSATSRYAEPDTVRCAQGPPRGTVMRTVAGRALRMLASGAGPDREAR